MKKQYGFTLLEVALVVVVIIGIVAVGIVASQQFNASKQATATPAPSGPQSDKAAAPISPTPTTTPTPTATPKASSTPAPVSPSAATPTDTPASVMYRVAAGSQSAQVSPVTTSLTTTGNVKLTINLTCETGCKFKLASDTYPLAASATYTSSQTITYTLTKHGTWTFYNEFTPNVKFAIKF